MRLQEKVISFPFIREEVIYACVGEGAHKDGLSLSCFQFMECIGSVSLWVWDLIQKWISPDGGSLFPRTESVPDSVVATKLSKADMKTPHFLPIPPKDLPPALALGLPHLWATFIDGYLYLSLWEDQE